MTILIEHFFETENIHSAHTATNKKMTKPNKMNCARKTRAQKYDIQKKPLTGYNLFFHDEQLKLPLGQRGRDLPKVIGAKWRNLNTTSRCMYDVAARERKNECRLAPKRRKMHQPRTERSVSNIAEEDYLDSYTLEDPYSSKGNSDPTSFNTKKDMQFLSESLSMSTTNASTQERILSSIVDTRSFLDEEFVEFVLSLPFQ